jgi:hypothetical protein
MPIFAIKSNIYNLKAFVFQFFHKKGRVTFTRLVTFASVL